MRSGGLDRASSHKRCRTPGVSRVAPQGPAGLRYGYTWCKLHVKTRFVPP